MGFSFRNPQSAVRNWTSRMTDLPYRVGKPWGYELIWARTDRYVGKILHIEAGHVLSLQYHEQKDEAIYILSGEIVLRLEQGGALIARRRGQGGRVHRVPTPEPDDVIRLKDRYGRVP